MTQRKTESGLIVVTADRKPPDHMEIHRQYKQLHALCPQCLGGDIETTCVGYIYTDLQTARDENRVTCLDCGYRGIRHDLVPKNAEGWVDVTHRLPIDEGEYLVACAGGMIEIMRFNAGTWSTDDCVEIVTVTHWRPLPALPNAEE